MQYRSVLFYGSKQECSITDQLIALFRQKGINVATQLQSTKPFYRAENYHQEYYERKGTLPYCHGYVKRF
ncbi:MAG: peptide-methionine (S)-S-oxide reductase [Campylobacterales bacterium]|nr:peptide-methionine (S)-S-oxide reductase [Campylobacterales bacterium]